MSLEAVSEEALTTMLHLVVAVHHPLETAPRLALNARGGLAMVIRHPESGAPRR